jgi:hypothetical protein
MSFCKKCIHHFLQRASFAGLFGTPAVTEKRIIRMFVRDEFRKRFPVILNSEVVTRSIRSLTL